MRRSCNALIGAAAVIGTTLLGEQCAVRASDDGPDFGSLARAYADIMIEYGRDRYNEPAPVFVTLLSRTERPEVVHEGNVERVSNRTLPGWEDRYYDRAWGGANLADHIQLHELLVSISAATGEPNYAAASDADLEFTFQRTQSPATGFIMWGEHLSYDVRDDRVYNGKRPEGTPHADTHEVKDPLSPAFWDRIYGVAPDEAFKFAKGLWDHQIYDQATGKFSRHAKYTAHGPDRYGASFPRVGGWMIHAWSQAYRRSDDPAFKATMLQAINTLAKFYESVRNPVTGAIPAGKTDPGDDDPYRQFHLHYWLDNTLLLAIELEAAMEGLPSDSAERLRALQAGVDEVALTRLEHNLDSHIAGAPSGFLTRARADVLLPNGTMQPGNPESGVKKWYSSDWRYGYGSPSTSVVAGLMVERYHATKDKRYLALITQAADRYLRIDPPAENTAPGALAAVIQLMLEAHKISGDQKYLDRATHFGHLARTSLLDGSPLPRATTSHNHYEAITGGDDLMLALWELSQATSGPKSGLSVDTGAAAGR